jgi:hypothetical protein
MRWDSIAVSCGDILHQPGRARDTTVLPGDLPGHVDPWLA